MIEYAIKINNGIPVGNPILCSNLANFLNIQNKKITKKILEFNGYAPFIMKDAPKETLYYNVEYLGYILGEDGFVINSYQFVPKSIDEMDEQQIAIKIRNDRNDILKEFDWYSLRKVMSGEPIPVEVVNYCQALRDLTTHPNFPFLNEEDWPEKPVV